MKILNRIGDIMMQIIAFLALIIDRAILVPFPFITSYSAQELAKKPDRYSTYLVIRVGLALVIFLIILLIRLIF